MKSFTLIIVLCLVFLPLHVLAEIHPQTTELSEQEKTLVDWVESNQDAILQDLKQYVEINTGTFNHSGIQTFRNLLDTEFKAMDFETRLEPGGEVDMLTCKGGKMKFADHLLATRTGSKNKKVFLNGHMDTVFSQDDEFQKITIEADDTIKGPGVMDMKGGLVVMIYALKALRQHGRLNNANVTVLLNTDEEVGSLTSRALIEDIATRHDIGLIFEGARDNKLVRQRKGLGQARIKITGRESHAGAAHAAGVSANVELAHKVIALESLTDYEILTTINVGTMQGGEKRNTRPGCAEAFVDLRYVDNRDGLHLKEQVEAIALKQYTSHPDFPELPKSEVWTILHRPAKMIHPVTDQLIAKAMGLSALIGERIVGTYLSGGGTDGSLTQAKGLPTLDSLGPDGGGAHSSREWTTIRSLVERTQLVAVLLDRIINQEAYGRRSR